MGGIAESINPNEEALALAAGNNIYIWDYDRPQCITTRPRKVNSLAVYNGRLIDSGNYNGIRDSLDNKAIAGIFHPWENIAVSDDNLFGTINSKNSDLYGVWDVDSMERVRKRNGRTVLLASVPQLIDSGEYFEFNGESFWEEPNHDADLYDTLQNKRIAHVSYVNILRAAINSNDGIITASSDEIQRRIEYDNDFFGDRFNAYTVLYSLDSDILQLYLKFSKLDHRYAYADANSRNIWDQFRMLYSDCVDSLPKEFRFVREEEYDGRRAKGIEIKPLPFDEACKYYNWRFKRFQSSFPNESPSSGFYLNPIFDHASIFLLFYHYKQNTIQGLANINDTILIGGKSKRLEIADTNRQESGENVLFEFSKPINAMTTVPIDVYNDGIKQRVLQRIRNRACHAKSSRLAMKKKIAA